jgi:hypothetical protein
MPRSVFTHSWYLRLLTYASAFGSGNDRAATSGQDQAREWRGTSVPHQGTATDVLS